MFVRFVCLLVFILVFVVVAAAATGPREQHNKDRRHKQKKNQKTLFLQGLGAFGGRGLANEKPKNKKQWKEKNNILLNVFVLLYVFLFIFISSACLLFFHVCFSCSPSLLSFVALTPLNLAKANKKQQK